MENLCPVCNSIVSIEDKICSYCGFSRLRKKFLTKKGPERWSKRVVIPYREKYEKSVCKQIMEKKDFVKFGKWYYDDDKTMLPIEWTVVSVKNNKAFLASRYCIDSMPYNNIWTEVTWETCTLRKWLNGIFLQNAFSADEQKSILSTHLNNSNPKLNFYNGGNDTYDKIFLLNVNEAQSVYFGDEFRKGTATPYAKKKGVEGGNHIWWLRNSSMDYLAYKAFKKVGMDYKCAEIVNGDGQVSEIGTPVAASGGIRPALWLDLEIK